MVNDRAMSRFFARLEATPRGIVACGGRANAGSSLAMRSKKQRPRSGRGLSARFQPDVIADQGRHFRIPIEVEPWRSASGRTDLPFSPSVTAITPAR
jgi:hypothetical protein